MESLLPYASLCISVFALGWNVYKDIIQKPKLRVSLGVYQPISMPAFKMEAEFILISGVNIGHQDIVVQNIILKFRKRKKPYGIVIPDFSYKPLPQRIQLGDEVQLVVPYNKDCFLGGKFYKIGLTDSYGRKHWASKKYVKEAKNRFREQFE